MQSVFRTIFFRCFVFLLFLALGPVASAQTVTVAVASNMKPAFEAIYQNFKSTHPQELRIVYGSSGNLSSQIQQGAPFNLFISADEIFPLRLYQAGLTQNAGVVYARGNLAFIFNTASGVPFNSQAGQIQQAITQSNKVVIANPELAPYGKAAVQYLRSIDLWEAVKSKLVYAENISLATMYVSSGAVQVGFSATSLAMSPELGRSIQYVKLPEGSYEPLNQRMVLMNNPPPLALELYAYLRSPDAKTVLQKYGYATP
ncbi:molybdate transport system substrate-binding protein [Polynucleobacter meluiroseus]|uniref:Molybdate transport system substrate-binding protein n=1 Tax=Polynucleobacter meluiroseus TaxID=1938814 RepID=A0A240E4L0_9BURK|nr:molybdate transport system substrate-binding protein [Polynucleobacter meluiroseus]